jgi:hypothetical protein
MSSSSHGWTLYVIDLKKTILRDRRFSAANPKYIAGKPCVYVGVTYLTAQQRFEQHISGIHSTHIVRNYGNHVRSRDCRCLRAMTRARPEKKEAAYAARLRERGWAVWSN